jgi:phosphatidylserine decarboxylase
MECRNLLTYLSQVMPGHLLTRLSKGITNSERAWIKDPLIRLLCRCYDINLDEAASSDLADYQNFNEFFTRQLKPGARTIDTDPKTVISPVDGSIGEFGRIEASKCFQAKGHDYSLHDLLAHEAALTETFIDGHFITLYLAPHNYHRVHMPFAGDIKQMIYVPGKLFSVNPALFTRVPSLFARNERVICLAETAAGPCAIIFVAAMLVAGIHVAWHGTVNEDHSRDIHRWQYPNPKTDLPHFEKGEELGYFHYGSTVICLFPDTPFQWQDGLSVGQSIQFGQAIGEYR